MSGNEDDKGDINKVYPLDLVSKLNVKPVTEIPKGTPLLMTGQPLRRVLTQAVAVSGSGTPSGTAINIVPQTIMKQAILNQTQSQNIGLTVGRPTQITLATSVVQSGATYHVPRGPATVANLATPRSAVATPIRASGGIVATPALAQQSAGGGGAFVSTVRQVSPSSRTPSPATNWLAGNMNMQIQNQQIVKNVVGGTSTSAAPAQLQRISTVVGRTQIITRTTQTTTNVTPTPLTSVSQLRQSQNQAQAVLHSAIISGGQSNSNQQQIHTFKTTLAQVLPTRSPQTLVYSNSGNVQGQSQTQHHHFMTRSQIGSAQRQINITSSTTTTTPTTTCTTRALNQMIGARVAVSVPVPAPLPVSVPVTSTRLTVTPGPTTIYTTGARLSAHNIGAGTRINVQQQSSNVNRSNVAAAAGTLLTTTQARITVANAQQQQNAVVIGTQAGGRLAASVVSLHPVVVGNPSQTARHIVTQQQQQVSKMITQSNQGQTAIQLAQIPTVAKLPVVPVSATMSVASGTRTINAAIVSQRHVPSQAQAQTITIPLTKVFPAAQGNTTTPIIRRTTSSPVASNSNEGEVTTYYYHDTGNANDTTTTTTSTTTSTTSTTATFTNQVHGLMSGQSFQFSPVMVVEQKRTATATTASSCSQQFLENTSANPIIITTTGATTNPNQLEHINMNPLPSIGKVTSSPRPSILRKRDRERDDGSTLKVAKNLAPLLSNINVVVAGAGIGPTSPPSRPLSRDNNGNSSGGSTTISATSSPGLGEIGGDDSLPLPPVVVVQPPAAAQVALKLVEEVNRQQEEDNRRHGQEMSPRKKPRKQQLIGNDEPKFNIDDMQFLSENKMKKELDNRCGGSSGNGGNEHLMVIHQLAAAAAATTSIAATTTVPPSQTSINNNEVTVKKPQSASLLNSYRQTWKSTHNHYLRYTDVKPKDERRPTIIDLANQSQVMQKINGWKIHHLSTQMEDLCDLETQVYDKLSTMLKLIETKESRGYDKDFNRINELIKGNMQRSKIINDSTSEAKSQVMKIFDHKEHVADIIQRCASKRNFKKREK